MRLRPAAPGTLAGDRAKILTEALKKLRSRLCPAALLLQQGAIGPRGGARGRLYPPWCTRRNSSRTPLYTVHSATLCLFVSDSKAFKITIESLILNPLAKMASAHAQVKFLSSDQQSSPKV